MGQASSNQRDHPRPTHPRQQNNSTSNRWTAITDKRSHTRSQWYTRLGQVQSRCCCHCKRVAYREPKQNKQWNGWLPQACLTTADAKSPSSGTEIRNAHTSTHAQTTKQGSSTTTHVEAQHTRARLHYNGGAAQQQTNRHPEHRAGSVSSAFTVYWWCVSG